MENHYFSWENPLEMVIFYSYVKLPEGTSFSIRGDPYWSPIFVNPGLKKTTVHAWLVVWE